MLLKANNNCLNLFVCQHVSLKASVLTKHANYAAASKPESWCLSNQNCIPCKMSGDAKAVFESQLEPLTASEFGT